MLWMDLCCKMDEESWSRTRLRTKKGACKEHADPLKWQIKVKEKGGLLGKDLFLAERTQFSAE